jgi:hypothetical protein
MTNLVTDLFTGADASFLDAHAPDFPSGASWSVMDTNTTQAPPLKIMVVGGEAWITQSAGGLTYYYSSVVAPSNDISLRFSPKVTAAYNSAGESGSVYGRVGVMGRSTHASDFATAKMYTGYRAEYTYWDNNWRIYRMTPGSSAQIITIIATTTTPVPLVVGEAQREFTVSITGTSPVVVSIMEGATTILTFSDSDPARITAGVGFGLFEESLPGQSPFMNAFGADSLVASTPVSFSGPVPTRNGAVGTAASFANAGFFAGSATPFAYTLQAGVLPAGLTLSSSTGIVSGTPTTAGTSSGIVIRATDANLATADTNAYSIVIAATNASPTFPGSISNISGTAGSAITPVNVSGQFSDTDALVYTASPAGTAWPSALVVNSSTGIISGTVAGAGTTTGIKVRATDTASQTVDSNAFNAVIAAAPTTVTFTPTLPLKRASSGALRTAVAVRVSVLAPGTDIPIVTVASITTHATTAVPPAFTVSGPVAGTSYPVKMTNIDDATDYALSNLTPT